MGAPVRGARVLTAACLAALALAGSGCHREERFESVVQIIRKEVVDVDAEGKTQVLDMEVEWDPCPGDQFQVIRNGKTFAACAEKYGVGDYVPVVAIHRWDPRGYYTWDISQLGDCPRSMHPGEPGSYEKSAECKDVKMHGNKLGFSCSRKPFRDLVQRCPWTARE